MARVAAGDIQHGANVVFSCQRGSQFDLVSKTLAIDHHRLGSTRLLIAHIEYLITRAQILFPVAMAVQAPLHLQRLGLIHQWHPVDWTMARIATHTLGDVNAVIEKNEVRELVHSRPLKRLSRAVTRAHRLQQLRVGPDLRMAVHAGARRRNACEARDFNRGVAIAAIDTQTGNVMLMAEGHGLRLAHACISDVGRALNLHRHPTQSGQHEDRAKNRDARQSIRAAMKDLRHSYVRASGDADAPQSITGVLPVNG